MRTRRFHRRFARFLRYVNAFVIVAAVCGVGFFAGAVERIRQTLPPPEKLATYRPSVTSELYSTQRHKDGKVTHTLLARLHEEAEDRVPITLRDIPLELRQATIAGEDRRFPYHRGVDPRGVLRAVRANLPVFLRGGEYRQGGSTLTQQLARAIWLSPKKTIMRKLKEILLALELERKYSKDEILEMYLNQVSYGHGCYGVKRAAEFYFGKEPKDLTLGQCALLAGLPRAPTYYSPYSNPQAAKQRRKYVLDWMAAEGYITRQQADAADHEQIQIHLAGRKPQPGVTYYRCPDFTNTVIQELEKKLGSDILRKGGLRVYTTLDLRVQEAAEEELTEKVQALRRNGNIRSIVANGRPIGQGALACVEVRTGRVLAMAGGVGPFERPEYYNRAHPGHNPWGRQVGSSFKPYVFAAALESGFGPDSSLVSGVESVSRGSWHPRNYTGGQEHMWTLRNALAQSVNLVAVRLIMTVGLDKAVRYASRIMDIPEWRFDKFRYYSLALGTANISPLEHASGYAVFANGGQRVKRTFVDRIEDYRGNVLYEHKPEGKQVIKHETAISMISMLGSVISYGTGRSAQAVGCPAGGKTGTTQNHWDVWWVGFTPDLSAAVWIGNDDNTPMYGAAGGRFCAPVWASFMRRAIDILGCNGQFPQGAGVTGWRQGQYEEEKKDEEEYLICEESHGLATPFCPDVKRVKMKKKDRPKPCTIHTRRPDEALPGDEEPGGQAVTVCAQSGLRATANCPNVETRVFAPGQAPRTSCTIHGPGAEPEPPRPSPTPGPTGPIRPGRPPESTGPKPAEPPTTPPKPEVPTDAPPRPAVPGGGAPAGSGSGNSG